MSYRREGPAHIQWCEKLALGLRAAGYLVYLDSLDFWSETFDPELVANFVAKLGQSDIVVPVITESYLHGGELVGQSTMRAWLWEEWSRIATLRNWGLLEVVAVWRSGDLDQEGMVTISGAVDRTVDVRDSEEGAAGSGTADTGITAVLDYFGTCTDSTSLSDEQQRNLASVAASIVESGAENGRDWCSAQLESIEAFQHTEEYWLAKAWSGHASGAKEVVLEAAIAVFRLNATLPTSFSAAKALWLSDLDHHAVGLLAEVAETPSLWRHQAHFILGDIFERLGVLVSAANHYRWCLAAQENDELNSHWSRLGPEATNNTRARLAEIEPAIFSEGRQVALRCEFCGAEFYTGTWICALCAASYRSHTERCFSCGAGVLGLDVLTFCVVCRKGLVEKENYGKNHYIVPREPGGRFSVLSSQTAPFPPSLQAPEPRPLGSWQQFVTF